MSNNGYYPTLAFAEKNHEGITNQQWGIYVVNVLFTIR